MLRKLEPYERNRQSLIRYLENLEPKHFDMSQGHLCLAGHCLRMLEIVPDSFQWTDIKRLAAEALGLRDEQAKDLFSPEYPKYAFTLARAIKTMKCLADTDEVVW